MISKIYDKVKLFILENIRFLIILSIVILVFTYKLPYVIYTPGGLVDLGDRIEIDNSYNKDGSLNMSYVSLRDGTLPNILLSYVIPNWDLKKDTEVTLKDETLKERLELEKIYMEQSINNATILAYGKSLHDLEITKRTNYVSYIADFSKTNILVKDEIISVEGLDISNIEELIKLVDSKEIGDKLDIIVKRDNKEKKCYAKVIVVDGVKKIGIAFLTTYEYDTDPIIKVSTKASESGSSGGLMLALAIYNDLVKDDLTKGRTIVGTGTISVNGDVGAIDGVKYKMLGAAQKDADIFLCPTDNYEEALKVKEKYNLDLTIKSVKTFDEALEYLLNSKKM